MAEATYQVALEGVSIWCLRQAVTSILRGGLGHAFYPSPPEFRMHCEAIMKPVLDALTAERREQRRRQQEQEQQPREISEAERQRVRGMLHTFRAERERQRIAAQTPELVQPDEERDERLRQILAMKDRPGISEDEVRLQRVVSSRLERQEQGL